MVDVHVDFMTLNGRHPSVGRNVPVAIITANKTPSYEIIERIQKRYIRKVGRILKVSFFCTGREYSGSLTFVRGIRKQPSVVKYRLEMLCRLRSAKETRVTNICKWSAAYNSHNKTYLNRMQSV